MMNIQNLLDITKGKENVNQNCNWDSTVELEVLKRQARNAGEDLVKKEPSHNVWNGTSVDSLEIITEVPQKVIKSTTII